MLLWRHKLLSVSSDVTFSGDEFKLVFPREKRVCASELVSGIQQVREQLSAREWATFNERVSDFQRLFALEIPCMIV